MISNRVLLCAMLVLVGCDKTKQKPTAELTGCDRYAQMEVLCGSTKGEGVRDVAHEYCEKAQKDPKDVLNKMIALEAKCAQTTTECAPYAACIEKTKKATSPFDP
ncbi:MAG: hypothetical protein JWO36_6314 [Myxococcales bacterium]|nr:hypothetical protein [Myxococcales bacterium]